MAIIKNEKYQVYAHYQAKDVPTENLKILVTAFLDHAALNMGANVEKANVDRVIEIIADDYSELPVNQIGSAFSKGSMGYWGEGRLIPKKINEWLKEQKQDYQRWIEHKDRADKLSSNILHFMDLDNCPLGRAINKKIDWYRAGGMIGDEWDQVNLKLLAEMIGRGEWPTPQDFGIKH